MTWGDEFGTRRTLRGDLIAGRTLWVTVPTAPPPTAVEWGLWAAMLGGGIASLCGAPWKTALAVVVTAILLHLAASCWAARGRPVVVGTDTPGGLITPSAIGVLVAFQVPHPVAALAVGLGYVVAVCLDRVTADRRRRRG